MVSPRGDEQSAGGRAPAGSLIEERRIGQLPIKISLDPYVKDPMSLISILYEHLYRYACGSLYLSEFLIMYSRKNNGVEQAQLIYGGDI
jgi:hypothetical protein